MILKSETRMSNEQEGEGLGPADDTAEQSQADGQGAPQTQGGDINQDAPEGEDGGEADDANQADPVETSAEGETQSQADAEAGASGPAGGEAEDAETALSYARSKLAEIRDEQSIAPDAVDLFEAILSIAGGQAAVIRDLAGVLGAMEGALTEYLNRPAPEITAAGIDLAPVRAAADQLAELRATGAISGSVATILEGLFAALGAPARN